MHNAGILLGQGFRGQAPDDERALKYLTRAADKGLSKSMLVLGIYYLSKNKISDAIFWLEKAKINREPIVERYLEIAKQSAFESPTSEAAHLVDEDSDRQLTQLIESTIEPVSKSEGAEVSTAETDSGDEADWSDSSEDEEVSAEIAESTGSSKTNSDFQKLIKNPKFLREQLRKLGRKKLEIDQLAEDHRIPTDRNRDTVERIKNFDAKLSYQDISELFKDPYFKNEVRVSKTKSGIQVKSIKGISAGTHRNHTKKYDGYHRNFLKDLKKVLESFSL
ncbi:MAG: sel1 repeat family protein [Alphaproteobacteria bacterium]|nr:sel1 repeat family protein [Alphaproteobacteria bacterium]